MAKDQSGMKPQGMRSLLIIVLLLVVAGGGAAFYYGLSMVREYAEEVNNRLVDADASAQQLRKLQALRQQIAQNESLITKADKLFVGADSYQVRALADINAYASQTGIKIASTGFDDPSSGSYTVNVELRNPVTYAGLIQFLTLVEGNLPKMQISSITLKHIEGSSAQLVEVDTIKINVLVK